MKQHVFKRSRTVGGKRVRSKTYTGRYRLDGDLKDTEIPLGVTDKEIARAKLKEIVERAEMERHGLPTVARRIEELSTPLAKTGPRNVFSVKAVRLG